MNRNCSAAKKSSLRKASVVSLAAVFCLVLLTGAEPVPAEEPKPEFQVIKIPIPEKVVKKMKQFSWRKGCPVPIEKLSYLKLSHWGYDNKVHQGELVVHEEVADDLVVIFETLFNNNFAIEKMRLIDEYKGSDDASMEDNNTSGFNCRWVTGRKGVFSNHSYGRAVDINPIANPYVKKKKVLPPAGKAYKDRTKKQKGMILDGDVVHQAFSSRGWTWGGNWRSFKDYQHFEKKKKKASKKK